MDIDVDSNNDGWIDPENGPHGTDDPIEEQWPGRSLYLETEPFPDELAEARLTFAQDEVFRLMASNPYGWDVRLEALNGAECIRVWGQPDMSWELDVSPESAEPGVVTWELAVGSCPVPASVWVSGVQCGSAALHLVLSGPEGEVARDQVQLTVVEKPGPKVVQVSFVQVSGAGYGRLEAGTNPDGTGGRPRFMGGDRFFPDAESYATRSQGRNIVRVRAIVEGATDDDVGRMQVYFRSFDVDDPSDDLDIDGNDQNGAAANDNRGRLREVNFAQAAPNDGGLPDHSREPTEGGFAGYLRPILADGSPRVWQQLVGGRSEAFAVLRKEAATGRYFAEVDLATSYAPGDNYRVYAAVAEADVQSGQQRQANDVHTAAPNARLTPQLSVWRYLHIEQDRMAPTQSAGKRNCNVTGDTLEPVFGVVWVQLDIVITEYNQYEGGILRKAGVNYKIETHGTGTTVPGTAENLVHLGGGHYRFTVRFPWAIDVARNQYLNGVISVRDAEGNATGQDYSIIDHSFGNEIQTMEVDFLAAGPPSLGPVKCFAPDATVAVQSQTPLTAGPAVIYEDDWKAPEGEPNGEPVPRIGLSAAQINPMYQFLQNTTNRDNNRLADAYLAPRLDTLDQFDSEITATPQPSMDALYGIARSAVGEWDRVPLFWVAYLAAMYEPWAHEDGDPNDEPWCAGYTVPDDPWNVTRRHFAGFVFLETCRDVAEGKRVNIGADKFAGAAALHEIGHQLGLPHLQPGPHPKNPKKTIQPNTMSPGDSEPQPTIEQYYFHPLHIACVRMLVNSPGCDIFIYFP